MSTQSKGQIRPYLSDPLYKRFKRYCRGSGVTESSVVEAALQEYFDDTKDMKLLLRRLDRQGRSLARLERDLDILAETLAVYIQLWLAHTPQIADSEKEAAQRSALRRFQRFLDHVAEQVARGHRFFDDLVQEVVADDEELAAIALAAGAGAGEPRL